MNPKINLRLLDSRFSEQKRNNLSLVYVERSNFLEHKNLDLRNMLLTHLLLDLLLDSIHL
eukprot:UN08584